MALTAEEQQELAALEAKALSFVPKPSTGLTQLEQIELAELEDKEKTYALNSVQTAIGNFVRGAVRPIGRTIKFAEETRLAGRSLVKEMIDNPSFSSIGWGLIAGVPTYVFSPLIGAAKGIVGEPIQDAAIEAGVPKNIAQWSGRLSEEAVYFIPIGGTIAKMSMLKAAPGLKGMEKVAQYVPKKKIVPIPEDKFTSLEQAEQLGKRVVDEVKQYVDLSNLAMKKGKPELAKQMALKAIKGADDVSMADGPNIEIAIKELINQLPKGADKFHFAREAIDKAVKPAGKVVGKASPITEPHARQAIIDTVTEGAAQAMKGNFDESRRIFKQLGEHIVLGDINIANMKNMQEVMLKYNMSPVDIAKTIEETVSFGGHVLGRYSMVKRQILKAFKDHPEALQILEKAWKAEKPTGLDIALEAYYNSENFRRALMVTQTATSMRNIWSQTGRAFIGAFDQAFQGLIRGTFGMQGNSFQQMREGLNTAIAALNRMSPKGRKKLFDILEQNHAVIEKLRLFNRPYADIVLTGRISKIVNIFNKAQEFFFRRIGFEAKLRTLLQRRGLNFSTINPKDVPLEDIAEAVNYALEMTFAANAKSKAVQKIIRAWTEVPGLTLVQPYPRFNFANAIPFIYEHSPLGYLHAVSPNVLKELASGNPERFAKYASRATIGSLLFDAALHIRQSPDADPEYYKIKGYDTRPFAPLSFYLFMAENFVHPERLKPMDYAQAVIGMNRVSGTGLVLLDWLRAKSGESLKRQMGNFAGQYGASYLTPFRTPSDIYSAIDPEEAVVRDYKQNPLIAPFLLNLPKLSQLVPEKPSMTSTLRMKKFEPMEFGKLKIPGGIGRQLTGLAKRTRNELEKEIVRVGLDWTQIYPRTGVPEADRAISRYAAIQIEKYAPILMNSKEYKNLTITGKRIALAEMFKEAREEARQILNIKNPALALKIAIEGMSDDMEQLIKERQGEELLKRIRAR